MNTSSQPPISTRKVVGFTEQLIEESALAPLKTWCGRNKPVDAVVIHDGNHLANRLLHTQTLDSPGGEPTEILCGTFGAVIAAAGAVGSHRHVVVYDGAPTARRALFPQYKCRHDKQRTPEEAAKVERLVAGLELAREVLPKLGVVCARHPNVEGDDLIGLLTRAFPGTPTIVISDDKDFYQLVRPGTTVFRPIAKKCVDPEEFMASMGFDPRFHPVYKALIGENEAGDNIPGVDGIGDQRAASMVGAALEASPDRTKETCDTLLEGMIRERERLRVSAPASLRKHDHNLVAQAANARLSLKLATITRNKETAVALLGDELWHETLQLLEWVKARCAATSRSITEQTFLEVKGRIGWSQLSTDALRAINVKVRP